MNDDNKQRSIDDMGETGASPSLSELQKATEEANKSAEALRSGQVAFQATRGYLELMADPGLTGSIYSLGSPAWVSSASEEIGSETLSKRILALVQAHLDLFEVATERGIKENTRFLAEKVRLPSLAWLQNGFLCLSVMARAQDTDDLARFEAILRKGQISAACQDRYVGMAVELLEMRLEDLKMLKPFKQDASTVASVRSTKKIR